MLDPEDRRLYSQCFGAPDGFVFDCALGTTYSLDLESLLFVQFCIATSGAGEPEAALKDPVGLLEAIHRTARRVTVFCHAGETNAPSQPHSLYALLEQSIVPARGKAGGAIFHPKLWVLRFTHRDTGSPWLRVVVLSRNLTTSRAWDSFLCLEGEPSRGRKQESKPLAALIDALAAGSGERQLALYDLGLERREQLDRLSHDVGRSLFDAPQPFDGAAEFITTGFGKQKGFAPEEKGDSVLAVSPFVSNSTLDTLRALAKEGKLIGRPEEMAKCRAETIAAWDAFALDEAASSDADTADLDDDAQTADAAPQGLHAKVLAVQGRRRTTWYFGSGNLTDPVRTGSSVEAMVRLEGKTSKVGISSFLEAGFEELLVPYRHAPPSPDPQDGTRAAVEKAKNAIAAEHLELACKESEGGWELMLSGMPTIDEGVVATARPISLPPARAVALVEGALVFKEMTVEALTCLVCFHLTAGKGEAKYETALTLKLPITGLPADRDAKISRSIIKDRSSFLRYLQCLLGGVGDALPDAPDLTSHQRRPGAGGGGALFASGLLEQLLKALHHEPERLRGLRSLLEKAGAEEEGGEQVVPEEFREIWSVIEPHLPKEEQA